jgi:hypothetical protein
MSAPTARPDFRRSARVEAMVEALFQVCLRLDRGDTLANETITETLGFGPDRPAWRYCARCLARRVEHERGITLWPDYGVGLRLCTQDEQLNMVPRKRAMKAARQHRRARNSLAALPTDGLTPHQLMVRSRRMDQQEQAEAKIRESLRTAQAIYGRPDPMPRVRPW